MNGFKQKWMPHLLAIGLFVVLSVGFFPKVYQGYVLKQGDIISWVGMSRAILDFREAYDQDPLWTWSAFSGMPAYLISAKSNGNLIASVLELRKVFPPPVFYFLALMINMYILLMSLKVKPGLGAIGAVSFAFSSFFMVSIEAGHNTKIHAVSYIPLIIAGIVYLWNKKYLLSLLVFAVGLSLQIKANHLQITYYTAITVGVVSIFSLVRLIQNKEIDAIWKSALVLVVGSILALGTNVTNLWSTYEYSQSSTRGKSELTKMVNGESNASSQSGALDKDYITSWSQGIGETWSLVFANAKGGATGNLGAYPDALKDVNGQFKQYVAQSNAYWGNQPFTSGPVYVGAIIALLFLLGAITVNHWLKWPLVSVTILALMLAWGKNFMWLTDLFIDNFPMYNKFRTVTMWLVIVEFTMPLMAILFLHQLMTDEEFWQKQKKKILMTSGVFVGILLLFLMSPTSFFDFHGDQEMIQLQSQMANNPQQATQFQQLIGELEVARVSLFKSDLLRSLGFIILAIACLALYVLKRVKGDYLIYGLLILVTIDLWSVDKRFINGEKERGELANWMKKETKATPYPARQVDLNILQLEAQSNPSIQTRIQTNLQIAKSDNPRLDQNEQYKVMFSTLDSLTNYRVLDLAVNTFNTAQTAYFHKGVGGYHAAKLKRYQELIEFHISRATGNINQNVLNMLNTKYIITPGQNAQVQSNPKALGNAWFVQSIKWVANADDEITALNEFDPSSLVIVDERFRTEVQENFGSGSIELVDQRLNRMRYVSNSATDGFAVFSEVYYHPGWNAYIDGQLVPHVRVNYVLRGMNVPAGEHTIEFKFEPASYSTGEGISYASSILILVLGGLMLFQRFKKES